MNKIVLTCMTLLVICACERNIEEAPDCPNLSDRPSYALDIAPIIRQNCAIPGCHVTGFEKGDFTSHQDLSIQARNGMLEFMIISGQMPHTNTPVDRAFGHCEMKLILKWINNGFPNN